MSRVSARLRALRPISGRGGQSPARCPRWLSGVAERCGRDRGSSRDPWTMGLPPVLRVARGEPGPEPGSSHRHPRCCSASETEQEPRASMQASLLCSEGELSGFKSQSHSLPRQARNYAVSTGSAAPDEYVKGALGLLSPARCIAVTRLLESSLSVELTTFSTSAMTSLPTYVSKVLLRSRAARRARARNGVEAISRLSARVKLSWRAMAERLAPTPAVRFAPGPPAQHGEASHQLRCAARQRPSSASRVLGWWSSTSARRPRYAFQRLPRPAPAHVLP